MLTLLILAQLADTVRLLPASGTIDFDGRVTEGEYGSPTVVVPRPAGSIRLWLLRDREAVYLAAAIPDPTFYWGDDVVISLDTEGDRAPGPMHDDFQWYLRRVLDSSVVFRGEAGKWRAPRDDPDWRLGAEREGGGWAVRSATDSAGWSLELRLDPAYFEAARGASPGLAVRVYDDDPHGWFTWPRPAGIKHPAEVEHRPALWVPVLRGAAGSG